MEIQNKYFESYEDIQVQRLMVEDKARTEAYKDAVMKNTHLFKGKIIMDVGAGTGILSLFAARAGAQRVYAVEASSLAALLPQVAADNGFGDVVRVFEGKVEDFALPKGEKVDVLISEWMGFYLLHESMIDSVLFARDHFLCDDGVVFPSEAKLFAAPCSLEAFYEEQFYYWDDVYGYSFDAIKRHAFQAKKTKPEVCSVKSVDILADPVCVKAINMRYATVDDIRLFSCTSFVGVTKSGDYQGLALWFDCEFDGRDYDQQGNEMGCLTTLSTSPFSPPTHWKQTVIIFGPLKPTGSGSDGPSNSSAAENSKELEPSDEGDPSSPSSSYLVEEDEVVGWRLHFRRDEANHRHYSITFEMLDPETAEHPIPCSCPMPRCLIIAKMIDLEDEKIEQEMLDESCAAQK